MSEANVELARRGWEAATRGDLDLVASMLDPDVKWHGGEPDDESACHNRSQALRWMEIARAHRPLPELVDVRDAGDKVVLVLRPRPAVPNDAAAKDATVPSLSANVSTFRGGKVVEMVHFDRAEDALRAVGLEP